MDQFWRSCMNVIMGSGGLIMMLLMIVFWAAVIVLVILGMHRLLRSTGVGSDRSRGEDPLQILDRRFAAGQMDEREYERRRQVLTGSASRRST